MIHGLSEIGGYVAERESDQRYHDQAEKAWRGVMKLGKNIDQHYHDGHPDNSNGVARGGWLDLEKFVDPKLKGLFLQLQPKLGGRSGGFGSAKLHADNPDDPTRFVIILYTPQQFINAIAHGNLEKVLKPLSSVWYHEFVHYLDTLAAKGHVANSEKSLHGGEKPNWAGYFNTPTEVNAYFHQMMRAMYHELRRKKNHVRNIAAMSPNQFVQFVIKFLPDSVPGFWESMTPENQKRLRLRMVSYFKDVIVPDANRTMARAANRANENLDPNMPRFAKVQRVEYDLACPHCNAVMGEKDFSFKFGEDGTWTHSCDPSKPFRGTEEQEQNSANFAKQFGLSGDKHDVMPSKPVATPVADPGAGTVATL